MQRYTKQHRRTRRERGSSRSMKQPRSIYVGTKSALQHDGIDTTYFPSDIFSRAALTRDKPCLTDLPNPTIGTAECINSVRSCARVGSPAAESPVIPPLLGTAPSSFDVLLVEDTRRTQPGRLQTLPARGVSAELPTLLLARATGERKLRENVNEGANGGT